jgi:hypothetical protein
MAAHGHRPRHLVIAGAVACCLGVATGIAVARATAPAATPLPRGPVSQAYISQLPAARLCYPGATVLWRFGHGGQATQGQLIAATTGEVARTSDPPTDVYRWYQARLLGDGWTHYRLPALMSTWASAEAFQRGRERFVVAIDMPSLLSKVLGRPLPPGDTTFEYRYEITS